MAYFFDSDRCTSSLFATLDEAKKAADEYLARGMGRDAVVSLDGGDEEEDTPICRRTRTTPWRPALAVVTSNW